MFGGDLYQALKLVGAIYDAGIGAFIGMVIGFVSAAIRVAKLKAR